MKKYNLIIEKNKDGYWGQVEEMPAVYSSGGSIDDLVENTKEAMDLYAEEMNLQKTDPEFSLVMDIQQFFKANDYINITSLAKRIGMNTSLLRQYSKGIKYPSIEQVNKIEKAIKQIARELLNTELQPM